jgi:hypothetical protein
VFIILYVFVMVFVVRGGRAGLVIWCADLAELTAAVRKLLRATIPYAMDVVVDLDVTVTVQTAKARRDGCRWFIYISITVSSV